MTDKTGEQISALLDDEVRPEEAQFAVRLLCQRSESRAQLERYALIREAMQGHLAERTGYGLADRIAARLEELPAFEQAPAAVPTGSAAPWRRPALGFGLAASVAVLGAVGMGGLWQPPADVPTPALASDANEPASSPLIADAALPPPGEWSRELERYLVDHNEFASQNSVHGVVPYVRMVGHETGR